jgi:hypothetical protein
MSANKKTMTWPAKLPQYNDANYIEFVHDMVAAGYGDCLRHYKGRSFYEGPGVDASYVPSITASTKVECVWDSMGLDYIVYPA